MSQLCAAEGKFRQLNAIKEGLDMQLVKQAHFLLLIGRDLHSDIGTVGHYLWCVRSVQHVILGICARTIFSCNFVNINPFIHAIKPYILYYWSLNYVFCAAIVSKAQPGSNPAIPTIVSSSHHSQHGSNNASASNKVSDAELTQAFARPDESTSRSVGSLTAGGAIGMSTAYLLYLLCLVPYVTVRCRRLSGQFKNIAATRS